MRSTGGKVGLSEGENGNISYLFNCSRSRPTRRSHSSLGRAHLASGRISWRAREARNWPFGGEASWRRAGRHSAEPSCHRVDRGPKTGDKSGFRSADLMRANKHSSAAAWQPRRWLRQLTSSCALHNDKIKRLLSLSPQSHCALSTILQLHINFTRRNASWKMSQAYDFIRFNNLVLSVVM